MVGRIHIKYIIEATTNKITQSDTYAVLMERDRLFAVNISAYPPKDYFMFDLEVFLSKSKANQLDYISWVAGFYPLPRNFVMTLYRLNRNEKLCSFCVQDNKLHSGK